MLEIKTFYQPYTNKYACRQRLAVPERTESDRWSVKVDDKRSRNETKQNDRTCVCVCKWVSPQAMNASSELTQEKLFSSSSLRAIPSLILPHYHCSLFLCSFATLLTVIIASLQQGWFIFESVMNRKYKFHIFKHAKDLLDSLDLSYWLSKLQKWDSTVV